MIISNKHGLNPSIDTCFFCGEAKGIALFGKMKGDVQAPQYVLLNYEPCDKCKELMNKGTTIIEVEQRDNGNMPIQRGLYPTGRWCVVRSESAKRIFNVSDKRLLLDCKAYARLLN